MQVSSPAEANGFVDEVQECEACQACGPSFYQKSPKVGHALGYDRQALCWPTAFVTGRLNPARSKNTKCKVSMLCC